VRWQTLAARWDFLLFAIVMCGFLFVATARLADVPVYETDESYTLQVPYEMLHHGRLALPMYRFLGGNIEQVWHSLTPLFFLLLSGFLKLFGFGVLQGRIFNLITVALTMLMVYLVGRRLFDWRAGLAALVLFVVPLVTGLLVLIPGQTTTSLGVEIAAFGLLVGRVLLRLGSAKLKDEPRAIVVIDRLSPRAIITTALIACGASLVVGHFGGLYWLAGAHVGALLVGLLNAWIFLLVAGADKGE